MTPGLDGKPFEIRLDWGKLKEDDFIDLRKRPYEKGLKILKQPYQKWYEILFQYLSFGLFEAGWYYKVEIVK